MSKRRRRGSTAKRGKGPTTPKSWDQQMMILQVQLQYLESLYNRAIAANQVLQANTERVGNLLIAAVIAGGNEDEILVSADDLQRLSGFAAVVPSEDEDGNLILTPMRRESIDEIAEEE